MVGAKVSFDDFLVSEGQYWEPEKMIKEVEQMRWVEPEKYGGSVFFYAENICPEVTLFEGRYLPTVIVPSAFGNIHYYYESRRTAVKPKHYSECAEFSEYLFHNLGEKKLKGFSHSSSRNQIPENKLEDYLVNNIEALENGLKFVDRQKSIGKWAADIFASDSQGFDKETLKFERHKFKLEKKIASLESEVENTKYGQMYEIRGKIAGPNGRTLTVCTMWMTETATGDTKFITMYPDKESKNDL